MSCIYGRYNNLILSITSSTASCLSATAKLHFLAFTEVNQFNWELPPPPPQQAYSIECLLY